MSSPARSAPSDSVIRLHDVGVRYRGHEGGRRSFKQMVVSLGKRRPAARDFWALSGVDLTISAGEVVGVIGRNGAGKSTLLSVLSRVLKPTKGAVTVNGRIAPLLALGAGFDTELSGSENIYLLGALLGFTKRYVDSRYDEIVAFSELQDFIEAPIRTYSSGMLARLGFAIATAAEADILLVDEVLAVGDERFRKKCEERMRGFRENHMTIVLVSHVLATVREMCTRVIWVEKGQIAGDGAADAVTLQYEAFVAEGKYGPKR